MLALKTFLGNLFENFCSRIKNVSNLFLRKLCRELGLPIGQNNKIIFNLVSV